MTFSRYGCVPEIEGSFKRQQSISYLIEVGQPHDFVLSRLALEKDDSLAVVLHSKYVSPGDTMIFSHSDLSYRHPALLPFLSPVHYLAAQALHVVTLVSRRGGLGSSLHPPLPHHHTTTSTFPLHPSIKTGCTEESPSTAER